MSTQRNRHLVFSAESRKNSSPSPRGKILGKTPYIKSVLGVKCIRKKSDFPMIFSKAHEAEQARHDTQKRISRIQKKKNPDHLK